MKYPSDTIIRKDVLDTLKWWQEEYPEIPHLAEIVADMEHLPPVQEQPEIVRCRECKYRTQGVGGFYMCNRLWDQFIDDDFFCADGERRSENDTHIQV